RSRHPPAQKFELRCRRWVRTNTRWRFESAPFRGGTSGATRWQCPAERSARVSRKPELLRRAAPAFGSVLRQSTDYVRIDRKYVPPTGDRHPAGSTLPDRLKFVPANAQRI